MCSQLPPKSCTVFLPKFLKTGVKHRNAWDASIASGRPDGADEILEPLTPYVVWVVPSQPFFEAPPRSSSRKRSAIHKRASAE
jgi:hypothetical protein